HDGFSDGEEMKGGTDPKKDTSNPITAKQFMLSEDQLRNADIDGDGVITASDVNVLSNMVVNFVDLNKDKTVNQDDLTRLEQMVYFASLGVSMLDIENADINGDGYVNAIDERMLEDAIDNYKDVNRDGVVDQQDINIINTVESMNLRVAEVEFADLNSDGIINKYDYDRFDTILKFMNDLNGDLDTDGDGILDSEELASGCDWEKADTDGDGFSDGEELAGPWSPTNNADHPATNPIEDQDGDGVLDNTERSLNSLRSALLVLAADEPDLMTEIANIMVDDETTKETFIAALIQALSGRTITSPLVSVLMGEPIVVADYLTTPALKTALMALAAGEPDLITLIDGIDSGLSTEDFLNQFVAKMLVTDTAVTIAKMSGHYIDLDKDGLFDWQDADADGDGFSDGEETRKGTDPSSKYSKPLLTGMDHVDVDILDDVIEFLSLGDLSQVLAKADLTGGLNGAPDGQLTAEDLEALNEIMSNLVDVNNDGYLSWLDVDRIMQIIGTDALGNPLAEQVITVEQVRRADIDGIGGVDTNDINLIRSLYERLQKADVNNDGKIGNGPDNDLYWWNETTKKLQAYTSGQAKDGGSDDVDYMKAVMYYRSLMDTYDITVDDIARANLNGDTKVNNVDVQLFSDAFRDLYALVGVKDSVTGSTTEYRRGDFDKDGDVDADDLEFIKFMKDKIQSTISAGTMTMGEWTTLIADVKEADFDHDEKITENDKAILTSIKAYMVDVDADGVVGGDNYKFDPITETLVRGQGGNGIKDEIDKMRLIMANQRVMGYHFTDAQMSLADLASPYGEGNPELPYRGKDGYIDIEDEIAYDKALDIIDTMIAINDYVPSAKINTQLLMAISDYLKIRRQLGEGVDLERFDINVNGYEGVRGDGFVNQADVAALDDYLKVIVDLNGNNTFDMQDANLFLKICYDSAWGYLETSILGISEAQVRNADVNEDGRISQADIDLFISSGRAYDIDGDTTNGDADDEPLLRNIHKYMNSFKVKMAAELDGNTTLDNYDYVMFDSNYDAWAAAFNNATTQEVKDALLAKYDINGDDRITRDDAETVNHMVQDYIDQDITKAMYEKVNIDKVGASSTVVDAADKYKFELVVGQNLSRVGDVLIRLDMNDDGWVNSADLELIRSRVLIDMGLTGANSSLTIFNSLTEIDKVNFYQDYDSAGRPIIDDKDIELLDWATQVTLPFSEEIDQNIFGANAVRNIIKFQEYKEANEILNNFDANVDGQIDLNEVQAIGMYYKQTDLGKTAYSESLRRTIDLLGPTELGNATVLGQRVYEWARNRGTTEKEKRWANLVDEPDNLLDDEVGQEDIDKFEWAITQAAEYDLVHDHSENNDVPIINDADIQKMNTLINHVLTGTFGTGITGNEAFLLPVVFRGDFQNLGIIDQGDYDTFATHLNYLVDLTDDYVISELDRDKIAKIAELFEIGIKESVIASNPYLDNIGDIDGVNGLTENDINLLDDVIENQDAYNVDCSADGLLTLADVNMVKEIFEKYIDVETLRRSDVNGNGRVDTGDAVTLEAALVKGFGVNRAGTVVGLGADLTGDLVVDSMDVLKWVEIKRYDELEKDLFARNITIDYNKYDIADSQDRPVANGVIDYHDRKALALSLSKIRRDITGDNELNDDDLKKMSALINVMAAYKMKIQDVLDSDINNDGKITSEDYDLISRAYLYAKDVDGDGKRDIFDLKKVRDVVDYIKLRNTYTGEDISRGDINGDGIISEDERAMMIAFLNNKYDIVGNDGLITQEDITALDKILAYVRLNITDDQIARSDITNWIDANGDGAFGMNVEGTFTTAGDVVLYDIAAGAAAELKGALAALAAADAEVLAALNGVTVTDQMTVAEFIAAAKALVTGDALVRLTALTDKVKAGEIDQADLYIINEAIISFAKADITGPEQEPDGVVDHYDGEAIDLVARFAATSLPAGYDMEALRKADINGDGYVNENDIKLFDYYNSDRFDFYDIDSHNWNNADVEVLTKMVKYFELGVDAQEMRDANIDRLGGVDEADITKL
ncbi:MAG: dockerin type I domain-containing protein, partial [Candidatus Omnitrophota bacterium]